MFNYYKKMNNNKYKMPIKRLNSELKILDTLKKSPHYIFDSVLFSNTKNEKVCTCISFNI